MAVYNFEIAEDVYTAAEAGKGGSYQFADPKEANINLFFAALNLFLSAVDFVLSAKNAAELIENINCKKRDLGIDKANELNDFVDYEITGGFDDDYVNLASEQRTQYILYGDATGGGHLWPGQPGESVFPQLWSADKIMHYVSDMATDPSLTGIWTKDRTGSSFTRSGLPSRYYVDGIREGITIRVVVEPAGEGIITAFPLGQ